MSFKLFVSAAALVGAAAVAGAVIAAPVDGAATFAENCAACHQPQGQGVTGAFPKLAASVVVQGDPANLGWILTHGRGGMPNFSEDMSDDQIAAVLTYIRSSWGNAAGPVDAALVKAQRGAPKPVDTGAGLPFH